MRSCGTLGLRWRERRGRPSPRRLPPPGLAAATQGPAPHSHSPSLRSSPAPSIGPAPRAGSFSPSVPEPSCACPALSLLTPSSRCGGPPRARRLNPHRVPESRPCVLAPPSLRSVTRPPNPTRGHARTHTSSCEPPGVGDLLFRQLEVHRAREHGLITPGHRHVLDWSRGRVSVSAPVRPCPPPFIGFSPFPAPPLTWAIQREVADCGVASAAAEAPGDLLEACGRERRVSASPATPSPGSLSNLRSSEPVFTARAWAPPSLRSLTDTHLSGL